MAKNSDPTYIKVTMVDEKGKVLDEGIAGEGGSWFTLSGGLHKSQTTRRRGVWSTLGMLLQDLDRLHPPDPGE